MGHFEDAAGERRPVPERALTYKERQRQIDEAEKKRRSDRKALRSAVLAAHKVWVERMVRTGFPGKSYMPHAAEGRYIWQFGAARSRSISYGEWFDDVKYYSVDLYGDVHVDGRRLSIKKDFAFIPMDQLHDFLTR